MESYYMIERATTLGPVWLSDDPCWAWSPTAALGRRYDRREDAERDAPPGAVVTEHADMTP